MAFFVHEDGYEDYYCTCARYRSELLTGQVQD
jgi:hypothetical protein